MYLKAAGLVLIVLGAACMGAAAGRNLSRREASLGVLLRMVILLKGEISYGGTSLGDACRQISRKLDAPFGDFLAAASRELETGRGESAAQIWKRGVETFLGRCALTAADKSALLDLGKNLGYLDQSTQVHHLELYEEELRTTLGQVRQELPQKKKIYQTLGLLGGLFLAVFLC